VTDRCEMVLLVQAESDGELDAAQAARLRTHREHCSVCRTAELDLARAQELLREMPYQRTPDAIRDRVLVALDTVRPTYARGSAKARSLSRFRWWPYSTAGFGVGVACGRCPMSRRNSWISSRGIGSGRPDDGSPRGPSISTEPLTPRS
jgi:hypothetical protein